MSKLEKGVNDLATIHSDLAAQWHPTKNGNLKPDMVTSGSGLKVWWVCKNGHEWDAIISNRVKGVGCPYCNGKMPIVGATDLKTLNPRLASEWDYELNKGLKTKSGRDISTPDKVTANSGMKVTWKCENGHRWKASIWSRVRGNGCPCCAGNIAIEGVNDLQTINPNLAKEWHPTKNGVLKPTDVTAGSGRKVWWYLQYDDAETGKQWDFEWLATINSRNKGNSCPYITNKAVYQGYNDLATVNPELALQWHPTKNSTLKPTMVTYGSERKIWWLCPICEHEWYATINSRTNSGCGCPFCLASKGEKKVKAILIKNKISFKPQNTFYDRKYKGLLRDDFAIFNTDGQIVGTIEFYGEQHYNPVDFAGKGNAWAKKRFIEDKKRDVIKVKYLQEHNIPQLVIPYWEFKNIDNIVNDFIKELSKKHNLF